jgi:hypothetical protein
VTDEPCTGVKTWDVCGMAEDVVEDGAVSATTSPLSTLRSAAVGGDGGKGNGLDVRSSTDSVFGAWDAT